MNVTARTGATSYQDVLAAVREYAEAEGQVGLSAVRQAVAEKLGADWFGDDRYRGQVYRALEALRTGGLLIRTRNVRASGYGTRREPGYETIAYREARLARKAEADAAEAKIAERWKAIRLRLAALGYLSLDGHGEPIRLGQQSWEALLDDLERSGG